MEADYLVTSFHHCVNRVYYYRILFIGTGERHYFHSLMLSSLSFSCLILILSFLHYLVIFHSLMSFHFSPFHCSHIFLHCWVRACGAKRQPCPPQRARARWWRSKFSSSFRIISICDEIEDIVVYLIRYISSFHSSSFLCLSSTLGLFFIRLRPIASRYLSLLEHWLSSSLPFVYSFHWIFLFFHHIGR